MSKERSNKWKSIKNSTRAILLATKKNKGELFIVDFSKKKLVGKVEECDKVAFLKPKQQKKKPSP